MRRKLYSLWAVLAVVATFGAFAAVKGATPVADEDILPSSPSLNAVYSPAEQAVDITVTAPTKGFTADDETVDLGIIPLIEVVRRNDDGLMAPRKVEGIGSSLGTVVGSFENVEPGAVIAFEDKDVTKGNSYIYFAIVYYGENFEASYERKVYAGVRPGLAKISGDIDLETPAIDLTIVTPTTGENGSDLEEGAIESVVLKKTDTSSWDWEQVEIKTWENVANGATLTYEDTDVELGGQYIYLAVVNTAEGSSIADITLKVGDQIPGKVQNLEATVKGAEVTLTWDPVTVDEFGEPLEKAPKYVVEEYDMNTWSGTVIGETTETSYTFDSGVTEPTTKIYRVGAFNETGDHDGYATIWDVEVGGSSTGDPNEEEPGVVDPAEWPNSEAWGPNPCTDFTVKYNFKTNDLSGSFVAPKTGWYYDKNGKELSFDLPAIDRVEIRYSHGFDWPVTVAVLDNIKPGELVQFNEVLEQALEIGQNYIFKAYVYATADGDAVSSDEYMVQVSEEEYAEISFMIEDLRAVFEVMEGESVVDVFITLPTNGEAFTADNEYVELDLTNKTFQSVALYREDENGKRVKISQRTGVRAGNTITLNETPVPLNETLFYSVDLTYAGSTCTAGYVSIYTGTKPANPTDIKAVAEGAEGGAPIEVSFTTPTTDTNGNELTALDAALFYRVGPDYQMTLIGEVENPGLGETVSYTDETAEDGNNYTYYGTVKLGEAETDPFDCMTTIFVGLEKTPAAPQNLKATVDGDKVILTWDAVTTGLNGGAIDTDLVTYTVYKFDPEYFSATDVIAENIKEPTYTITLTGIDKPTELSYQVRACIGNEDSGAWSSPNVSVITGPADKYPFYENVNTPNAFGGPGLTHFWTIKSTNEWGTATGIVDVTYYYPDGNFENEVEILPVSGNAEGDGFIAGTNYGSEPLTEWLTSYDIDLTGAVAPELSFFVYQFPASMNNEGYVTANILVDDDVNTLVEKAECSAADEVGGWKLFKVDASEFAGKTVKIQFVLNYVTSDRIVALDDIALAEGVVYDAVKDLTATVEEDGETIVLEWSAPNKNVVGYDIYVNGNKVNTEIVEATTAQLVLSEIGGTLEGNIYQVRAIYEDGESALSNEAVVEPTLAEEIEVLNSVRVDGRNLIVENANGALVAVYDITGYEVLNSTETHINVELNSGIYAVVVGDKALKVLVK